MNLAAFRTLLTPAGQATLAAAEALHPREANFLAHFQTLSKQHPPDLARAALETAIFRQAAVSKFPDAARMYFTRESLEQATPAEVSAYRAARYRDFPHIADLACSIGGDTLALASLPQNPTGRHITGLDLDPLRLHLAQANAQALGLSAHTSFIQANLTAPLPFPKINHSQFTIHNSQLTALFFDPARRTTHPRGDYRRAFSVHDYTPPLDIIRTWLPPAPSFGAGRFPALGVKISPGVNLDELAEYDCEIEFISLHGELKEACLWFGPLKTATRRATLLPGPHTLVSDSRDAPPSSIILPPSSFLYEPDPAILRAGLVIPLAAQLNAAQLDPTIAYLTSDTRVPTPFARAWPIEDWMPFNLKKLRAYLRERHVGQVTVKKRGSPLEPESLIRDLRLKGDEEKVLVLTKFKGDPVVLVCTPPQPQINVP